jgi:hypothetical protein
MILNVETYKYSHRSVCQSRFGTKIHYTTPYGFGYNSSSVALLNLLDKKKEIDIQGNNLSENNLIMLISLTYVLSLLCLF